MQERQEVTADMLVEVVKLAGLDFREEERESMLRGLTEELALEQARRADDDLELGRYRGSLNGIP